MSITVDEDSLLVQKMRMGDEKAFNKFITKYYPAIFRYCQIHIKDYGYAEDMTQETFTRFFRTFRQYKHYGKAVNYLYTIASNICSDYYRKKKELLLEELPENPDENINDIDNKIVVSEALDMLPAELKEVAVMFFIQELKQKDIAVILGVSIPLVKYRIRKAREQLVEYFGKEQL